MSNKPRKMNKLRTSLQSIKNGLSLKAISKSHGISRNTLKRYQINSGKKQLYGTQFAKVDPINKIVELAETEDLENLDMRRMKIGMMPIQMYKEFMLKNLSK
jgi:transposase-like protein